MQTIRTAQVTLPPVWTDASRGVDELNLASLCLISVQSRLPKDFVRWEETFMLDGRPVMIRASGLEAGLPHGIDVDTNAALINLFLEQGCPADNTVVVSMYELLRAMRLDDCGASYRTLNESLRRMLTAFFYVQGWFDANGGVTRGFTLRLIEKMVDETSGVPAVLGRPFGNSTRLRLTLAEEIAGNIRLGYMRALDLDFMSSLGSPLTRGLFRLLDAESDRAAVLEVNLVAWGKRCRLPDLKPYRLRRTFEPAHRELIEKGYLVSAEYVGTAQAQQLIYTFARQRPDSPMTDTQLLLLGRIKALDVAAPQAEAFVRSHPEAHVRSQVARAEAVLAQARGVKKRGAMAWDVLNDEKGKYVTEVAAQGTPARTLPAPSGAARTAAPASPEPVVDLWQDLKTPAARADHTVRTLKFLLGKNTFREAQFAQLHAQVSAGRIDGRDLIAEASRAANEVSMQAFADDLRQLLGRSEA